MPKSFTNYISFGNFCRHIKVLQKAYISVMCIVSMGFVYYTRVEKHVLKNCGDPFYKKSPRIHLIGDQRVIGVMPLI